MKTVQFNQKLDKELASWIFNDFEILHKRFQNICHFTLLLLTIAFSCTLSYVSLSQKQKNIVLKEQKECVIQGKRASLEYFSQ